MSIDYLDPLPGYLSIPEFAERKNVSRGTVFRWIAEDHIRAFKASEKTIVIPESELTSNIKPSYRKERAKRAREIAAKEKVTIATAYRYLKNGHRK